MPARTPKETFLILLSHVRDATEKGRQKSTMNSAKWHKTPKLKRRWMRDPLLLKGSWRSLISASKSLVNSL